MQSVAKSNIILLLLLIVITVSSCKSVSTGTASHLIEENVVARQIYDTVRVEQYHNTYSRNDTLVIKDSVIIYRNVIKSTHDTLTIIQKDTVLKEVERYVKSTGRGKASLVQYAILALLVVSILMKITSLIFTAKRK